MSEHVHSWQWHGYYFRLNKQAVLIWLCECRAQKEEVAPMSDWWYGQAYRIWMYEQKHRGIFDEPERSGDE